MRTVRTKVYSFSELSKAAKQKAVEMWGKYNNPLKKDAAYITALLTSKNWLYHSNGEMYNGLTN